MKWLVNWYLGWKLKRTIKKAQEKRLKDLKERDPFIY